MNEEEQPRGPEITGKVVDEVVQFDAVYDAAKIPEGEFPLVIYLGAQRKVVGTATLKDGKIKGVVREPGVFDRAARHISIAAPGMSFSFMEPVTQIATPRIDEDNALIQNLGIEVPTFKINEDTL